MTLREGTFTMILGKMPSSSVFFPIKKDSEIVRPRELVRCKPLIWVNLDTLLSWPYNLGILFYWEKLSFLAFFSKIKVKMTFLRVQNKLFFHEVLISKPPKKFLEVVGGHVRYLEGLPRLRLNSAPTLVVVRP